MSLKRIAVLGAESTGKTTLVMDLARELRAPVVPEVLRTWCEQRGRTPRQTEQRAIFDAQLDAERQCCAVGTDSVICDTTPLTIALASQYYFHDDSLLAMAISHQRSYAMTLLCMPDIPWVEDGIQRDGPHVRAAMHALIQRTCDEAGIAVTPVSGPAPERNVHALAVVRSNLGL